ncbi:MAG: helix-turn-helix transcriptional regulator [Clostridia bacterium]|nr:helix-turn-helix transcriptional regulator [Clostridia bacterium]
MKILHQYHTEPQVIHNCTVNFEPHLHGEVELIVLFDGTASARIGGKEYNLQAGDAVLVFPNTVHSYTSSDTLDVGKFIFSPDIIPDLKNTFTNMTPRHPVIHTDAELQHIAASVIRHYHHSSSVVKRAYLSLLTGKLLECAELDNQTYAKHDTLETILQYCETNFRSEISLQTLSEALNISKSHLSHIFSGMIKMDFRNYLNTLRLNHAYTLLAGTDLSMTEIAEQSGFSGLRTFNRTFRLHNGMSPTAYKKQLHKQS